MRTGVLLPVRGIRRFVYAPAATPTKEIPMRAIDCDCGKHMEAETDEALVPIVTQHMKDTHPEVLELPVEQQQKMFAERVHDV